MNDVSLTSCYLNDIQSPEKSSKNGNMSHLLNENSRDSIFFNVTFFQMTMYLYFNSFFIIFPMKGGHNNGNSTIKCKIRG